MRVKSQSLVLTALILLAPGAAWAQSGELAPPVVVREGQPRPLALTVAPRPSLITNPRWAERPRLVYPEPALAANVEGAVTMTCTVSRTGHLVDCEVVSDSTPGFGFAEAALSAAASARVEPRTVDGLAEDAKATWTARFRMPEAAQPALPPTGGALYDADRNVVDASPQWARRPLPTARDLPPRLLQMRGPVTAAAIVACRAEADGSLSDCRAESESPMGAGVGEAAVGIARRGRLAAPIAPDASGRQPTMRTTIIFRTGN